MDVICLFDFNGFSATKWAENGHDVYCYDIETPKTRIVKVGRGRKIFMHWDANDEEMNRELVSRHIGKTKIVLAFPPCTDLAVSGAAHFEKKRLKDPDFQKKAVDMVLVSEVIANRLGVRYAIENPVSVLATLWRKPDYTFHPWEYGGYLPENDRHPIYPKYIEPRDAYYKKTCYWVGNGFVMPTKIPVITERNPDGRSKQDSQLGGKSKRTKNIRSLSPRGVARAVYYSNHDNFEY